MKDDVICSYQVKLDGEKTPINHDFNVVREEFQTRTKFGHCFKLVCGSCGFVRHDWRNAIKERCNIKQRGVLPSA